MEYHIHVEFQCNSKSYPKCSANCVSNTNIFDSCTTWKRSHHNILCRLLQSRECLFTELLILEVYCILWFLVLCRKEAVKLSELTREKMKESHQLKRVTGSMRFWSLNTSPPRSAVLMAWYHKGMLTIYMKTNRHHIHISISVKTTIILMSLFL